MGRPRKRTKIDHGSLLDTKNNNTDPIPTDIVNEILHRLPSKSIAKFIRVSKSWAKIICSNYFIKSFSLQQQESSHRLLFAFNEKEASTQIHDHWSFFSSSSSVNLAIDNKKKKKKKQPLEFISRLVSDESSRSPIYLKGLLNFIFGKTQVVSNPSTGKSIVLPPLRSKRNIYSRYFGFDAIKGEYKVLCITNCIYGCRCGVDCNEITPFQNQILTIGSNSNTTSLWREIDVWIPHHRPHQFSKGLCIDGVIYYLADKTLSSSQVILVRFDVSSEKFLNQLTCEFLHPFKYCLSLINYESKLAVVDKKYYNSFDLWVLKDVEKVEWLKITYDVSLFNRYDINILSVNPNGQNIYTYYTRYNNLYVIYHDHQKNRYKRVRIKAKDRNSKSVVKVYGFVDYVESLMFL